jgi:glycosyltransferase involved in cell wall biosynthesis
MGSVLAYGDAVTNHILEIERRLRAWGMETRVFGANIEAAPGARAELDAGYQEFAGNTDDLLIYHYSAYCDNHKLYLRSRNRRLFVYHNVTPAAFFRPYDTSYEGICARGRALLPRLQECDLALGDSEYNRRELVDAGFAAERTGVLPIFVSTADLEAVPRDEGLYEQLRARGTANLLFVGRVAPNKAFEDLLTLFAAYRRLNRSSRLILVGARFLPRYDRLLERLAGRLGLADSVIWTNRVSLQELKTYYQAADLFLCASQHEGFCVPLVEAMHFDLPILARARAAVPDTLGQAGVQFHQLDHAVLAEVMDLLIADRGLRARVIAGQKRRLEELAPGRVEIRLAQFLASLGVAVPGSPEG